MSTRRLLFLAPAQAITGIFPPLRDAGYELGIAENLKGASVFIRKSGPGVIFARPSLPGFRVEDLLAVSAEDPNFPPVIVTTDKGSPEEAERLLGLGARDYWLEPLDVERIMAVAREPRKAASVPASSTFGGHRPQYAEGQGGPRIVGRHPAIARVLDLALQAKLLRVLQEGEIDRVGGAETVRVDVRVLATTNRDLEDWVKQGKFRQDLYFRLNVIPLRLPSLRERGDDVLELARFFVDLYVREYKLPPVSLSEAAVSWLKNYDFPGNVRELQNLMERAVLLANGRPVEPCHFLLENEAWPLFEEDSLPEDGSVETAGPSAASAAPVATTAAPAPAGSNTPAEPFAGPVIPLHEMERIMIIKGLEATSGNRTQAAELLGISVRTLRNKLNEYRSLGHPVD